jgi:hypothetical protein
MRARFTSDRWSRRTFTLTCVAVVAVQRVVIEQRRMQHLGDFDMSREFGRRLLADEHLYAGGLNYRYLPIAALSYAPLALLPPGIGIVLRYGAALGCTWLTLSTLHSMVGRRRKAAAMASYAVMALLLNREILGKDVYFLLLGCGMHTICMLLALGVIVCRCPTAAR